MAAGGAGMCGTWSATTCRCWRTAATPVGGCNAAAVWPLAALRISLLEGELPARRRGQRCEAAAEHLASLCRCLACCAAHSAGHVHFTHAGYIGSPDKAGPISVQLLEQVGSRCGLPLPPRRRLQLLLPAGGSLLVPFAATRAAALPLVQDEQGVYRFVCDDAKHSTFRNLVLKPPCMLW